MTPSGIEPATFRFAAKYLNHCATISGPHNTIVADPNTRNLCLLQDVRSVVPGTVIAIV
jgi:hypothetical protein